MLPRCARILQESKSNECGKNLTSNRSANAKQKIKAADFSEEQAKQLIPLHHSFAQRFNGPLHRPTMKYWTGWLKSECGEGNAFVTLDEKGEVDGFACFGVTSGGEGVQVVVKDFFVSKEKWERDHGRKTLQDLLEHFAQKKKEIGGEGTVVVRYPSAIMDEGKLYQEGVEKEIKESFLYRVLEGNQDIIERMAKDFVFWDVDKF